jgi:transposase-like protein
MADLKNRGVRDILIACCDGLAGSGDAIAGAFPATVVQRCVVHYADLGIMPTWHRDPARPYAQARAKPRKQGHKLYPHPPCRSAWCRRC